VPGRNAPRPSLFAFVALVGSAACNFEPAPKAYALVTVKHDESSLRMVAIMEIPGESECDTATREFMKGFAGEGGSQGWHQTETACQPTLEPLYQSVMNRETFHATYMAFSPRNDWEYEGRIVLYGISSSQAQEVCHQIAKEMGERLEVEVECVQGTVG
jgi:hypothetical protein